MPIVVEINADEKRFLEALRKSLAGMAGLEAGAQKVVDKNKELDKANADLERSAKRVYEETRTPQERYLAKMQELNNLLAKGKIGQEEYGRASKQAADQLEHAGNAGKTAFGQQALASVKDFATGILGVGSAAAIAMGMLQKLREAREEAAREAREAEQSSASLAQLALDPTTGKVDAKRFKQLHEGAKNLQASGGFRTREEANRLMFALASAGMEKEVDFYAQLHASGAFEHTEALARGTKTIMASMGKEAGSAREVTNAVVASGTFAPSHAEELAPAIARGGTGARVAGIKLNELAAATAIVSEATGAPEQAGTNIRQLLRSLGKIAAGGVGEVSAEDQAEGVSEKDNVADVQKALGGKGLALKGKSLLDQLRTIEAAGLDEKQLQKLYGRAQALEAHRVILTNAARYEQAAGSIATAQREDSVGQMIKLPATVPEIEAAQQARMQQARGKVAAEGLGTKGNIDRAVIDHWVARIREGTDDTPALTGGESQVLRLEAQYKLGAILPGVRENLVLEAGGRGMLNDDVALARAAVREHPSLATNWQGTDTQREFFERLLNENRDLQQQTLDTLKDIRSEGQKANDRRTNPTLGKPDAPMGK